MWIFATWNKFLGHIIDKNRVRPDPRRIIAVIQFLVSKAQKHAEEFSGLAGYIGGFFKIASSLNQLSEKDISFNWTEKQ